MYHIWEGEYNIKYHFIPKFTVAPRPGTLRRRRRSCSPENTIEIGQINYHIGDIETYIV